MNTMRMRGLYIFLFLSLFWFASYEKLSTTTTQLNLSLCAFIALAGVVFFDEKFQILSNIKNTVFYIIFSGLFFMTINESGKERFFLGIAGTLFALNIFFESDTSPWNGRTFFRTPWISTLFFANLIVIECIPGLSAETVMTLDLISLLSIAVSEIFILRRENGSETSNTYFSALRFILMGFSSYIYGHYFLPQISSQSSIFYLFGYVLIGISCISAAAAIFHKKSEEKLILFYIGLNCFLLWSATFSKKQGFEVIIASQLAAWALISARKRNDQILSRLLIFAGPAILLSIPILGFVYLQDVMKLQGSNLLWFGFIILSWVSLWKLPWKTWVDKKISIQQGVLVVLMLVISVVWAASINIDFIREKF